MYVCMYVCMQTHTSTQTHTHTNHRPVSRKSWSLNTVLVVLKYGTKSPPSFKEKLVQQVHVVLHVVYLTQNFKTKKNYKRKKICTNV